MKKVMYSMVTAAMMMGTISCSSDDDNNTTSTSEIANTVTSGAWRVTYFMDGDVDETSHFENYNFTFGPNNVLTASNGANTYTGIWNVSTEDATDDNPHLEDIDFDIIFNAPDNFTDLTEDWEILERTSTKLRMKHVSGGNGGVDYLTFEKNS
ncbi:hypothetical protein HYN48_01090 [Flavobacterium magnum]|uniref:Lipocalin-like domain-containing protein n=1 Tax=Flavobacterium magnum TaxID=2162713 RepID=A0A2S0RB74_9FLAO|nr:hypothetical protein [Flavobacterium magnum]AWA28794.1 hypothetical protein HYN48_01090 [Flavobacterium magnum]